MLNSRHLEWGIQGSCSSPVVFDYWSTAKGGDQYRCVTMCVRCRQCSDCLSFRSWLWETRAEREVARSRATLFGTLTVGPEVHLRVWYSVLERAREEGVEPSKLTDRDVFALRCAELGKEITDFQKRVRKQVPYPLRFMWVAEPHKSGLPHFHCLVHVGGVSPDFDQYLVYIAMKQQWTFGHSDFSGLDRDDVSSITYACKYLAKQSLARVRASLRYGA